MDCGKLTHWLRLEIFKDTKLGRCVRFCVRHIANSKLGSEILDVEAPEGADDNWIGSFVADVESHVEMDAGGLGGTQAYCILAFRAKEPDKATGRHTFRITVDEDVNDEPLNTEGPNKTGLVAQSMRHTEAMMRYSTVAIGQVIANQSRTIERLSAENEALLKQHARTFEVLEELQSHKHEREIEIRKAEFKEQVTRDMVNKAGLLLPSLVNRVVGKRLLPERTTPLEESIKQFMSSLTEDQMMTLAGVLTPEQQIALGSVVQSFDKRDEQQEQQELASKNGNGAADTH